MLLKHPTGLWRCHRENKVYYINSCYITKINPHKLSVYGDFKELRKTGRLSVTLIMLFNLYFLHCKLNVFLAILYKRSSLFNSIVALRTTNNKKTIHMRCVFFFIANKATYSLSKALYQ